MDQLLLRALTAAIRAGQGILEVYRTDFSVTHKSDDSPLTIADQRAHDIITTELSPLNIPILSEEGRDIPYAERNKWDTFWLIDPLDGTKEFIKKNDEFTVNIALIHNKIPVMGVIHVPVWGETYFAEKKIGAFKLKNNIVTDRLVATGSNRETITLAEVTTAAKSLPLSLPGVAPYTIVGSRSHATPALEAFVEKKRKEYEEVSFISAGSSLKICHVAEGKAAVYPRLGPTMEWDTAAGQAIAVCAGAGVVDYNTGAPLVYNKENLLNPWFIVEML